MSMIRSVITGTGAYIPTEVIENTHFLSKEFYDTNGERFDDTNDNIVSKFEKITGIKRRKYASLSVTTSDMGAEAARLAIAEAGIDPETVDTIIAAHNFGEVTANNGGGDIMPSISARIKHKLGIKNIYTRPLDMVFGCPGWVEGMILGHQLIQGGSAKRVVVIGTDILSRVSDPYDRDSMIFSDGAGAVCLEATTEPDEKRGVIGHATASFNDEELMYLSHGDSLNPNEKNRCERLIRMQGRKIYEFALTHVPAMIKKMLDASALHLMDMSKLLIHQANKKMDHAILNRLMRLYDVRKVKEHFLPMTIEEYGNSSVATVPTMLDLIRKNKMKDFRIDSGDKVIFASVGAGMNISAMAYQF